MEKATNIIRDDLEVILSLDLSSEEDERRRSAIKQKSARVLNKFPSELIDEIQKIRSVHVDETQRSESDWVPGNNVNPLHRLKASVPGEFAVRIAAIVIVILIIAYK